MMAKRMTLAEQALRARYFQGAVATIEERGGHLLREHTISGERRFDISGPSRTYELMTDGGRLELTVHDDGVMTRFERPNLAVDFCDCNKFSGKWNFHTFIEQQKRPTEQYVDDCLQSLIAGLSKVNARAFERYETPISTDDIEAIGAETLLDRQAQGEIFVVESFEREIAIECLVSAYEEGRFSGGEKVDPTILDYTRSSMNAMSNLEAYLKIKKIFPEALESSNHPAPKR